MAEYSKLGYGNLGNIDSAIEAGKLDGKDLVITKDTSELIYIRDDNTKQFIRSKRLLFDTVDAAVTALNAATDTYAGQDVGIKDADGKYRAYTVQNGTTGFTVEPVMDTTMTGFVWQEF